jgi:hypothetical protein
VPAFIATAPPSVPGIPATNSIPTRPAACPRIHSRVVGAPAQRTSAVPRLGRQVLRDPHHDAADPCVRDERVRAAAEDRERDAELLHRAEQRAERVRIGGPHEEVGGAADAHRGPRGERSVAEVLAADAALDL